MEPTLEIEYEYETEIEVEILEVNPESFEFAISGGLFVKPLIVVAHFEDDLSFTFTFKNENGIEIDPLYAPTHVEGLDTDEFYALITDAGHTVAMEIGEQMLAELILGNEDEVGCDCPNCKAEREIEIEAITRKDLIMNTFEDLIDQALPLLEVLSDEELDVVLNEISEEASAKIEMLSVLTAFLK